MQVPRLGIIGAGQLGRMMALAAYPLGIECRFVDRQAESPGGLVAAIDVAELDDAAALRRLADEVDVVTFDIENVSIDALRTLAAHKPVHPSPELTGRAQDRLAEKQLFASFSIPTARFVAIDSSADLAGCPGTLGWPIVLKARRLGYDGRGQRIVESADALAAAWIELGRVPAIAEAFVPFERELSLLSVRGADGQLAFYPLTENRHRDGILMTSVAPFEDAALQRQAEGWLGEIAAAFDYRGVLCVEFFHTPDGLVANEMAPRVHNSGHWTIEGAETSQFENHVRGVLGLPLGSTRLREPAAMLNLIGSMPERRSVLGLPGVHLHDYGKAPRPQRKLGHLTIVDPDRDRLRQRLEQLVAGVESAGG
jgi:5-(carboxyamino)imidazole ribonucleotide synthase